MLGPARRDFDLSQTNLLTMHQKIFAVDLGLTDYALALRVQRALHARCQVTGENMLILTQHLPVITLGYRRPYEQLLVSVAELKERGIGLVETDRGGGATYHGPGQLVAYPIFSALLQRAGVREFISRLEEVLIRVCRDFAVTAERQTRLPGVWVQERKIGAVGIAVRRGVSLHGCALNVNIDLRPFAAIVPCGLPDKIVTSLAEERGQAVPFSEVAWQTRRHFAAVFAAVMEEMPDEWCRVERETGKSALDYDQPS
jgi:lipoate-protein ligase B